MILTIIAVCFTTLYTIALFKAAAHMAHPGLEAKPKPQDSPARKVVER